MAGGFQDHQVARPLDSTDTVTVTATDLDIRDLTSASDSVEVLQDTHDDLNANANIQVSNTDVTVQNPLPVDGDSVYSKDVDVANSSIGGFSGAVTDLFDSVTSNISDATGTNPKFVEVALNRPHEFIEMTISTDTGNFSNVKIVAKDSSGATVVTIDDSASATDYTQNTYVADSFHASTLRFEFHTTDAVTLGFIQIEKIIHNVSHLHALKPDGTDTAIDATAGGNLKISMEELESGISSNSNSQLNVTRFDASGNATPAGDSADRPVFTSPLDYNLELSRGNIAGQTKVHKFGRNPDIDTASGFEAVWNGGGDYTGFDAVVAETLEVFSSAAADAGTLLSSGTATGGSTTTLIDTGATFVTDTVAIGDVLINDTLVDHGIITAVTETTITVARMQGGGTNASGNTYRVATQASTGTPVVKLVKLLNGSFVQQPDEYVILNGVTAVDTTATYMRCTRARCIGGDNAGTITARQKTTTANIMMVLPIGYNSTMIACDTVPAGKSAHIDSWFASLAGKTTANMDVRLLVRKVNDVFQVQEEFALLGAGSSYVQRSFAVPKDSIPEMSDIKVMADTDTNNTAIAAGFDITLIDN